MLNQIFRFCFCGYLLKKNPKMFRQNEQKQLWFINNTHTIYSWNNICLEIRWFSQSVSIAERCRDSLLSRCLPCDSQLELFLFIHSTLVTSLLAPAVVPSCTKSIAFKTVDSHSPRHPVVPCWSRWRAKEVFLLIGDFHCESRAVLSISPLTFHQNQNIPAGSALREVLLKFWVRENIFFNPGKQWRIDFYLQMQAEIHLGSWDFLPFLCTNGALISGKVL